MSKNFKKIQDANPKEESKKERIASDIHNLHKDKTEISKKNKTAK